MDSDNSELFRIPRQGENKASSFGVVDNNYEIYEELDAINKEIEQWRLDFSQN